MNKASRVHKGGGEKRENKILRAKMEKKSSGEFQFLPGSRHLPWPSFLPVTRRGRGRERAGGGSRRRAGLSSWATRAFLNCIPACVATSRFTHADTCVHIRAHMFTRDAHMHTGTQQQERLSGGGASSLTRKYSGQYIPSPFFFRSLVPRPPTSPLLSFRLLSCSFFFASSRPRNCAVS